MTGIWIMLICALSCVAGLLGAWLVFRRVMMRVAQDGDPYWCPED